MRTIVNSRGMLVGLALLATAGMSACSANRTPSNTGPGTGQTTTSAPVAAPSATPTAPRRVQNLVITTAEKGDLTAAFVAVKGIPLADIAGDGPTPGSVYYAYDPAAD